MTQTSAETRPTGHALLIRSMLEEGVRRAPDQEIVYADRRRLTYRQLAERVGRLASGLAGLGVAPGQTVAVMDWDSHRYLECFFAVPMMGAVLHTVNVRLSPEQILYTINHAEDDVLLVNGDFLPILDQIWSRVDPGKKVVLLDDAGKPPETRLPIAAEYEALLAAADPAYAFPDLDEETRATTFYTTGTTGLPKGVWFTHRQLVLHALAVRAALASATHGRFDVSDVYMPITPMFHVHAWGIPYVATSLGVKQVYPGRYLPEVLLSLLAREEVTFSHCVPTILQMLLAAVAAKGTRLDGWKVIIGGAALPRALARQALDLGADVFAGYGMSETCPVLTLAQLEPSMLGWPVERQVEIRTTTGRPIPLVRLRVVDLELRDVPHDARTPGEIVVQAPWLTRGYLKDPAASERLWAGGWLHTGDIAVVDPRGYVKITDRLKDVIKTGGEWVSSLALEDLILGHPGVAEAAVIGVPDPRWTERPLALVVPRPGQRVEPAEVEARLRDCVARGVLAAYAVPGQILIVDALPKTSVGKISKRSLREQYGQGSA